MITANHFAQLKLPERTSADILHLSSAKGYCMSAKDAVVNFDLLPSHFSSHEDMVMAIRSDRLWMWEERTIRDTDTPTFIRAGSSLPHLLSQVPGSGQQQEILEAFEALFPTYSLCFNDHLLAGYATVQDFVKSEENRAAFCGREGSLRKAIERNCAWTLVEQVSSTVHWAAAELDEVLRLAFEHHPVLRRQRELEAVLEDPTPRKNGPRF